MLGAIGHNRYAAGPAPLRRRISLFIARLFGAFVLFAHVPPATALEILGQVGVLGEWELNATLVEDTSDPGKAYSGKLVMRHVGICTQDGPEERAGEVRLRLAGSGSRIKATMVVEGVECVYDGRKSHAYEGMMTCVGREALPMMLWLK